MKGGNGEGDHSVSGSQCYTSRMADILWVEDQSHWIDKFQPILEATDFDGRPTRVRVFRFAEAACQHIKQSREAPDIALLDAQMNGRDTAGFSVSRTLLKKWPEVPQVYLSEYSGTDIEQSAFEQGGLQDFIAKHQRNIEAVLCWRIKAALRQNHSRADSGEQLTSGDLTLDTVTWEVFWHGRKLMNPNNPRRPLGPMPRKILRYLVEASPRPLSTLQMAEALDADPERFSYANYRQHIRTLRNAFQQASPDVDFMGLCQAGEGIVTFGDLGAYCWKPVRSA